MEEEIITLSISALLLILIGWVAIVGIAEFKESQRSHGGIFEAVKQIDRARTTLAELDVKE